MDAAQLVELAEDIKANGMQTLISIWIDDRETPGGDGPETLLDGPDRIKALAQHLGITDPRDAPYSSSEGKKAVRYLKASEHPGLDPATLVISFNLHRLHMGAEQRRGLIKVLIQEMPQESNRGIARMSGASHTTVAGVRESENGQEEGDGVPNGKMEHRPIERAKAEVRANRDASVRRDSKVGKRQSKHRA